MNKFAALLLAIPMLLTFSNSAKADTQVASDQNYQAEAAPLYSCRLAGTMKGASVAIGFGGELIGGNGYLTCVENATRRTVRYPVHFKLAGGGIGIDFSVIRAMKVVSAGIGVDNPRYFFRSFGIGATTGATLISGGVEFDTAFRVDEHGPGGGFEVGLQGRDAVGLGAHLYAMTFEISRR